MDVHTIGRALLESARVPPPQTPLPKRPLVGSTRETDGLNAFPTRSLDAEKQTGRKERSDVAVANSRRRHEDGLCSR